MINQPASHAQRLTDTDAAILWNACDLIKLVLGGHVVAVFIDDGAGYPWFVPLPGADIDALVRACSHMDWSEITRAHVRLERGDL